MEIPGREQIEQAFLKRLQELQNQHRAEFLSRSGRVGNRFWTRVAQDRAKVSEVPLYSTYQASANQHARDLGVRAGSTADLLDEDAYAYAESRADVLGRITTGTSRDRASRKEEAGASLEEIAAAAFSPHQAQLIAVSEVTHAQTRGGEDFIYGLGLQSDDDRWVTHPELTRTGPCPICQPLQNSPRSRWSLEFPAGPPAHPHCVCAIDYAAAAGNIDVPVIPQTA